MLFLEIKQVCKGNLKYSTKSYVAKLSDEWLPLYLLNQKSNGFNILFRILKTQQQVQACIFKFLYKNTMKPTNILKCSVPD